MCVEMLKKLKFYVSEYCDVPPESQYIGAHIYDCSQDNGVAKHVSPTMNNNSRERCVTTELQPL
jgi:hypothetical protein